MRILTFSSLFPSEVQPRHGIFVETRLQQLLRESQGGIDARVVAPVPWFPSRSPRFGRYAKFAQTPHSAVRNGLAVEHPRYPMLPRVGVRLQARSMAMGAWPVLRAWRREGWVPELIDAHYFYPDGVAAARLAQRLGVPFVVTARGTDVNVLAKLPQTSRQVLWAAERAAAVITVSTQLKDVLVQQGVDPEKITVLRNGVDLERFRPEARSAARQRLGLPQGRIAACVGNLVPEKAQALAVEALSRLPQWRLVIVGDGPMRAELVALGQRLGVSERLHFIATMPQQELRLVYSAADLLLLTSTREGCPNVVLESLACGTPVAAVDVGGVTELITSERAGRVIASRNPSDLAAAMQAVVDSSPDPQRVREYAAQFDWASISRAQLEIFQRAIRERRAGTTTGYPAPQQPLRAGPGAR